MKIIPNTITTMKKILLISIALFTTLSMNAQVEKLIYEMDWAGVEYTEWNYFGEAPNASYYKATDEGLAITNSAINNHIWEVRVINRSSEDHGLSLEEGHDYVVRLTLKVPSDGHIFMQLGDLASSWYDEASVTASDDWQVIDIESPNYYCDISDGAHVLLGFGEMVGTTILKKVQVYERTSQDTYLPFVELGKQWHVVSNPTNPYVPCRFEKYEMYDKEEVDGKTYVRVGLFQEESDVDGWEEKGLFREENRRVYKYVAGRDVLMYDFSLKEGDTFAYEIGFEEPVICKVVKQGWLEDGPQIQILDSLTADGEWTFKYRKLRTWTIGYDNGSGDYNEFITWIESIGALKNMFSLPGIVGRMTCLAYLERNDEYGNDYLYLPFSLYNMYGPIYGCNMPKGAAELSEDWVSQYTYELEGDRLHVHGKDVLNCAGNYYAYFTEEQTDDPSVHKLHFRIKEVGPETTCSSFYTTDFYVPGFSPIYNYIVVDDQGEEHSVINKTPQNEYRPFVEEDKVWKVGTIPTDLDTPVQIVDYYYFDGDTIIDGKTCKQMMCQHFTSPNYPYYEYLSQPNSLRYVGAWYEENKKVYFYDERTQSMVMKYDFSLEANDTLQFLNVDGYPPFIIGPKQTGGIEGFKGVYRDIMMCTDEGQNIHSTFWLEGVGDIDGPTRIPIDPILDDPVPEFLMSCVVGDEVIYLFDKYEDGATPDVAEARKQRIDFTHTTKIKPKTRTRGEDEQSLYGEYNDQQLDIHLDPLDDAYQVCITDESGKAVYEKIINAGNIIALNIDISAYAEGRYAVTVENSRESFTGEFETLKTGIEAIRNNKEVIRTGIYNLQGQRLNSLQKGLNIVNGQKVFIK